jgi:hypothetical protein
MLNEGNQIHNFKPSSGSGSDFLTSYGSGSGSTSQKSTVPVPQRWCQRKRVAGYGQWPCLTPGTGLVQSQLGIDIDF